MNIKPKRIDVHHHIVPPNFVSALNSLNVPWTAGPAKFIGPQAT